MLTEETTPLSLISSNLEQTQHAYKRRQKFLQEFAVSHIDMPIPQPSGDILVIGPGVMVPESTLFCTPESEFLEIRKQVTSVTFVGGNLEESPYFRYVHRHNKTLQLRNRLDDNVFPPTRDSLTYFSAYAQRYFKSYPDHRFHAIYSFVIPDLLDQLINTNLLTGITYALHPGGYYAGSGLTHLDLHSKKQFSRSCQNHFD